MKRRRTVAIVLVGMALLYYHYTLHPDDLWLVLIVGAVFVVLAVLSSRLPPAPRRSGNDVGLGGSDTDDHHGDGGHGGDGAGH
jgi:hypothetical protein